MTEQKKEQRIMTVHLRKAIEFVPRYKKASAASKFLSKFVIHWY